MKPIHDTNPGEITLPEFSKAKIKLGQLMMATSVLAETKRGRDVLKVATTLFDAANDARMLDGLNRDALLTLLVASLGDWRDTSATMMRKAAEHPKS